MHKNNGLSLTELLISLSLSMMIATCLASLLFSTRKTLAHTHSLQKVYAHARSVEKIFATDIHHAGYLGCKTLDTLLVQHHIDGNRFYNFGQSLQGYTSEQTNLPKYIDKDAKEDTDILVLRYLSPKNSPLFQNMASPSSPITLAHSLSIKANKILLISDCHQADLFVSRNTTKTKIKHDDLGTAYQHPARVGLFLTHTYFIKATKRNNIRGEKIDALYRENIDGSEQELVPGIDTLQITYSTDGKQFSPAKQIGNWLNVKKIAITFTSGIRLPHKSIAKSFHFIFRLRNRL